MFVISHWVCDNNKAKNKLPKMCFFLRFLVPYKDEGWNASSARSMKSCVGDGHHQYGGNSLSKRMTQGLGDSLVSKVFALRTLRPNANPRTHIKKLDMVHASIPSTVETRQADPGDSGQLA